MDSLTKPAAADDHASLFPDREIERIVNIIAGHGQPLNTSCSVHQNLILLCLGRFYILQKLDVNFLVHNRHVAGVYSTCSSSGRKEKQGRLATPRLFCLQAPTRRACGGANAKIVFGSVPFELRDPGPSGSSPVDHDSSPWGWIPHIPT